MNNEMKLTGSILAESKSAGTEADPIVSRIRPKYTDSAGKVHIALIETLVSCIIGTDGRRLDRVIVELQDAVGLLGGGTSITDIVNELINNKIGLLENLSTEDKNNVVAAINELIHVLSDSGLNNSLLNTTHWDDIPKTKSLKTTFFTNWTNSTELPHVYGSGVVIPSLDNSIKYIFYTFGVELYIGYMKFSSDNEYSIQWNHLVSREEFQNMTTKVNSLNLYAYKSLGDNYTMTAADFDRVGFYLIGSLTDTVTDEGVKNIPDNNVGDYKILALNQNKNFQTLLMTSPRYNNEFYIGRFWNNNWVGWTRIANTENLSNPNIIINSYFKNVINQRGKTEYTSGYSIDRWHIQTGTLKINNNRTTFAPTEGQSSAYMWQAIEDGTEIFKNKTVTLSIKIDNKVYFKTYRIPDLTSTGMGFEGADIHFPNGSADVYKSPNSNYIDVRIFAQAEIALEWIKLEYGDVATMYVPPNLAEELIKCMRYYQNLSNIRVAFNPTNSAGHTVSNAYPIIPMRVAPTFSARKIDLPYEVNMLWDSTSMGHHTKTTNIDFDFLPEISGHIVVNRVIEIIDVRLDAEIY